jgi:hypothetical protein
MQLWLFSVLILLENAQFWPNIHLGINAIRLFLASQLAISKAESPHRQKQIFCMKQTVYNKNA